MGWKPIWNSPPKPNAPSVITSRPWSRGEMSNGQYFWKDQKNINGMIWFEKFMTRQSNIYVKLKCLDTNIVSCLATWLSRYLDMYVWGRWWVGWWFKLNYIHQPGPANTAWSLQTSGSLIEQSTAPSSGAQGGRRRKYLVTEFQKYFPRLAPSCSRPQPPHAASY